MRTKQEGNHDDFTEKGRPLQAVVAVLPLDWLERG
jgi:hypothetical protein